MCTTVMIKINLEDSKDTYIQITNNIKSLLDLKYRSLIEYISKYHIMKIQLWK